MTRDPIVEEVRAVRDEIAKALDYDISAIFDAFRAHERASGRTTISLPPREPDEIAAEIAARRAAADE